MARPFARPAGLLLAAGVVAAAAAADPAGPPVRVASGVSGHIHPALCVTSAGTAVVVFSQADFKDLRFTRSTDGGRTWSEPTPFPGTEADSIYPGSLVTLRDGRVVHFWNVWYKTDAGKKSRFPRYAVSGDDGKTWSEPKSLPKNPAAESVVRHPPVELPDGRWLLALTDKTTVYDPATGELSAFGDGRNHGLVPLVRTPKGTWVSGLGLRSADDGKTWAKVDPFPKIGENGWRFDLTVLPNGWLVAGEVLGPGFGGDRWRFAVSRDDGTTWDFDSAGDFYNPGRAVGGRACPRTVQLDKDTVGTVFYDIDAKQPGGPGVFFLRTPHARLAAR